MVVCNFTPVERKRLPDRRPGLPGTYAEVFNTDAAGVRRARDQGNGESIDTEPIPMHGFAQSLHLTMPPLSVLYLRRNACT